MATVTGLTKERMEEMEAATIIEGSVIGDDLILETRGGTPINAGNVRGPQGIPGTTFVKCTSTTRPAYTSGDEGKAIYETDTKLVRIWIGTRWRVQERIICTNGTRPTGFGVNDEGVKIYETDTNLEYIWSGTTWILSSWYFSFASASARNSGLPTPTEGLTTYQRDTKSIEVYNGSAWTKPWDMPWGEVGYGERAATFTTVGMATRELVPGCIVTATLLAGRKLKATCHAVTLHDVGGGSGVCAIDFNGTQIEQANGAYNISHAITITARKISVAGTNEFKFMIAGQTGQGSVNASPTYPAFILVEDMGPA